MQVGDLVRYKYDHLNKKSYLVKEVDMFGNKRGIKYATLLGWERLNAAGLEQRFRFDQLEVVSHASR